MKNENFNEIQKECYRIAYKAGWWDDEHSSPLSQQIANMHGELSDAWEWYRKGNPPSDHIAEFSGIEEEMADTVIRIMDTCERNGYRLLDAIHAKMEFNRTRPYRHGNKKA